MSHLSPAQQKKIDERRAPKRHAMDRLRERHFPEVESDADLELLIDNFTALCTLAWTVGDTKTTKLVNKEAEDSVIFDLDLFKPKSIIRVCYNPVTKLIRTVFPKTPNPT